MAAIPNSPLLTPRFVHKELTFLASAKSQCVLVDT